MDSLSDSDLKDLLGFEPVPVLPPRLRWGIVGYRYFTDKKRFDSELKAVALKYGLPDCVVSGGATGADTLAREWAASEKLAFIEHPPKSHTARDLLARNTLIVQDSDLIIAFLSTRSRGTLNTIEKARRAGKEVLIIHID